MKNKKIFIVAGGTGGHVFPAIALIENTNKFNFKVLTDKRCKKIFESYKINFEIINSSTISKNLFLFPLEIFKIVLGIFESFYIFLREKPDLILSFGGYTCFPAVISAKFLSIPVLLHEQNAVLGKANRLLSIFSKKIALSFHKTRYSSQKNTIFTGLPLRRSFNANLKKNKNDNYFKILVIGGSQGSSIFSKIFPEIFKFIDKKLLNKIHITQQSRKEEILSLKKLYCNLKLKNELNHFFYNLPTQMKNADVIFSRCGASSLFEIESLSKYSILIPLPTSKDNHQYENAIQFSEKNDCMIVNEKKLNIRMLAKELQEIILKKKKVKFTKKKFDNNASVNITKLIDNILNND